MPVPQVGSRIVSSFDPTQKDKIKSTIQELKNKNETLENEIHSISPTFSYDYIEMIQDQWSVDVRV